MSYWQEIERGRIPQGAGCYVVYHEGVVVYVGSTERLEHRCRVYRRLPRFDRDYDAVGPREKFHLTPWGRTAPGSIRIKVKCSRRVGDWLMWEYRLIRRLQPHYNRSGRW